jgi:hypothetical protein
VFSVPVRDQRLCPLFPRVNGRCCLVAFWPVVPEVTANQEPGQYGIEHRRRAVAGQQPVVPVLAGHDLVADLIVQRCR